MAKTTDTDKYANADIEDLRAICQTQLLPGAIWRPRDLADFGAFVGQKKGWYWHDTEDGQKKGWCWHDTEDGHPEHHGPFPTERDALINAIETEGHDE